MYMIRCYWLLKHHCVSQVMILCILAGKRKNKRKESLLLQLPGLTPSVHLSVELGWFVVRLQTWEPPKSSGTNSGSNQVKRNVWFLFTFCAFRILPRQWLIMSTFRFHQNQSMHCCTWIPVQSHQQQAPNNRNMGRSIPHKGDLILRGRGYTFICIVGVRL